MKLQKFKSLPYIKFFDFHDDPYRSEFPNYSYCTQCNITYVDKHWKLKAKPEEMKNPIICPACKKIKDGYFEGILCIKGEFAKIHKDEIMNLLKNEEQKQRTKTALPRIGKIEEKDDMIIVYTTNDKLAYRFGKALFQAYKGDLSIKWSDGNIFTRVYWERN